MIFIFLAVLKRNKASHLRPSHTRCIYARRADAALPRVRGAGFGSPTIWLIITSVSTTYLIR